MFLTRQPHRVRSHGIMRMLRDDERGAALAAVLGLMATMLLLSVLLVTAVYQSTGFTSSSRAGVQSQAAAEAGVAAARSVLAAGDCPTVGPEITNADLGVASPAFTATITIPNGTAWTPGCPSTPAIPVRIVSTGSAAAGGAAGQSGSDQTTIEAVLSADAAPAWLTPSGPAVYAYSSDGFGAGGKLISVDGSEPDILVKTGDLTCSGSADGVDDFVVEGGDLVLEGSCIVTGNTWSSGTTTTKGNTSIGGNVVSTGLVVDGSSKIYGGAWVDGLLWGTGNGDIYGQAKAKSLIVDSLAFHSPAYIYGPAQFKKTYSNLVSMTVQQVTYPAGGLPAINPASYRNKITVTNPITTPLFSVDQPPSPIVPNWFDYVFDMSDWPGFGYYALTGTTCSKSHLDTAIASFAGNNGVIDARGCTNGIALTGSMSVTISQDIVLLADNFDFSGSSGSGSILAAPSTGVHTVWSIMEDTVANGEPDCDGREWKMGGAFSMGTSDATANRLMVYTPCRAELQSSNNIWGQIFAGEASINGSFDLHYVPVGLPGYDLDTGEPLDDGMSEENRTVASIRTISG